jgi:hypothetical protein
MRLIIQSMLVALAAILLAGCSGNPVALGNVTSTNQIDRTKGEHLTASASGFQLLLFIPIAVNRRQLNAYESLQEMAGDRALTDIQITESWTYALVGTIHTTTIDAMAYPKLVTPATPTGK